MTGDQTNPCYLKSVSVDDVEFIHEVANDEILMEILCDQPTSLAVWQEAVGYWLSDPDEDDFIIIRQNDQTKLGWIGINGLRSDFGIAWIKIVELLPQYWGQGYGTVSVHAVQELLRQKSFTSVRLWTDECNLRARLFYEKLGFVPKGTKKDEVGNRQIIRDRVLMEYQISMDGWA